MIVGNVKASISTDCDRRRGNKRCTCRRPSIATDTTELAASRYRCNDPARHLTNPTIAICNEEIAAGAYCHSTRTKGRTRCGTIVTRERAIPVSGNGCDYTAGYLSNTAVAAISDVKTSVCAERKLSA